jgi:hypothetical protein
VAPREEGPLTLDMAHVRRGGANLSAPRHGSILSEIQGFHYQNVNKGNKSNALSCGNPQGTGIAFDCEGSGNTGR